MCVCKGRGEGKGTEGERRATKEREEERIYIHDCTFYMRSACIEVCI